MNTIARGNVAEAQVLAALVAIDVRVLTPFGEGHPYDLVLDLDECLVRVQCKCSRLYKGCVTFNSRSTDHGRGAGTYHGLADLFGVYFPPSGDVFLVPVVAAPPSVTFLRLGPAKNNQRRGIRMAADYAVDRWDREKLASVVRPQVRSGMSAMPA